MTRYYVQRQRPKADYDWQDDWAARSIPTVCDHEPTDTAPIE